MEKSEHCIKIAYYTYFSEVIKLIVELILSNI